jgi:hypothetical protein
MLTLRSGSEPPEPGGQRSGQGKPFPALPGIEAEKPHRISGRKAKPDDDEVQIIRVIGTDGPIRAERYQSDGEN